MINCQEFYNKLKENNIDFFTGVPDSLLKDFCAYVTDNTSINKNIVAVGRLNFWRRGYLKKSEFLLRENVKIVFS